jgi:hypothetical protein
MTLTIHCGRSTPFVVRGIHQCRLASFAFEYQGWHTFNTRCRDTIRAIGRLEAKGMIEVVGDQFRWKPSVL